MFFIDLLTASHVLESITISASTAGDREAFAIRSDRVDCVSPGELLDTEICPTVSPTVLLVYNDFSFSSAATSVSTD